MASPYLRTAPFVRSALFTTVVLLAAGTHTPSAQPRPVQAAAPAPLQAQSGRVPQFDNDAVNVWRSTILPHQPLSLHRHDHPRVLVALTDGALNFIDSSGATQTLVLHSGTAYYLPAMPAGAMHSDINPGEQPIQVMMVELKHEK